MLADTSITKGKSFEVFKGGFLDGIKRLEAEVVQDGSRSGIFKFYGGRFIAEIKGDKRVC